MGNTQLNQMSYGAIFLRTDKPYNISGETVTGTVYINVIKSNFPGHVVYLKLKGTEQCNWEERQDLTSPLHEIQQGKNVFYCHKIVLYKFEESTLPVGQYALPFKFTLNEYLPGSYDDNVIEFMACIKYKLKAEIESGKRNINTLKHSQQLIVREQLKVRKYLSEHRVQSRNIMCLQKGYSHIKCSLDKSSYLSGESVSITVDIDNTQCNLDIKGITAVLRKIVMLESSQGKVRVFRKDIQTHSAQGCRARAKHNFQIILALSHKEDQEDTALQPCTKGCLIKCSYTITVQSIFKTWFCRQPSHTVNVPLNIVASGAPNWETVPKPDNWNPQTISAKFVIFSPILITEQRELQNFIMKSSHLLSSDEPFRRRGSKLSSELILNRKIQKQSSE